MIDVRTPYLVFLGAATRPTDAKTGRGLADWRPERCIGQLRYPGCAVDLNLPDMQPAEAYAAGARSLVIGIASFGGQIEPQWPETFREAMRAGLDIVSGMHTPLAADERLAATAAETGQRLVDVRRPPPGLPVASGRRRRGRRLLTVGTDCAVGKKYTALAIDRELRQRGVQATFRATGQTGILIAGEGIPMDAVAADFLAGAAEQLSPDNDPAHWDVIEGQGAINHPAYAAVTLGLVLGSQPDALVLCHDATRKTIDGYPEFPLPGLGDYIRRYLDAARLTNPQAACVGISLNTSGLNAAQRKRACAQAARETGLPAADPLTTGVGPLVDALLGAANA